MTVWEPFTLHQAGVTLIDCVHATPQPVDSGYPYVAIPQMKGGHIDFSDARQISVRDFELWTKKARPQLHDVVLSRRTNPGVTAVARDGRDFALGQNLVLLRADGRTVLPQFLRWLTRGPSWWEQIEKFMNVGAVFNSLRCADVPKFLLPIPPKAEQERIAAILDDLDDKIELNRRMNETLEAMAQAIFRDWFVDFGPTRRKLEGANDPLTIMGGLVQDTERAQAITDLFPPGLGDDGLPEGWIEAEVASVVTLLKRGLAPSYCDDGILVINQKCIRGKALNYTLARRHDAAKRAPKERVLEENDVLVNSTGVGTLGRVATVRGLKETATADSHVTICRADTSKISKLILSLFMEDKQSLIETLGHGSTGQTELSPASLGGLMVTVAPKSLQAAFEEVVRPLRDLVTHNSDQSGTLAQTRDLLLPKLMSGEIRLQEADEVLEAAQ